MKVVVAVSPVVVAWVGQSRRGGVGKVERVL